MKRLDTPEIELCRVVIEAYGYSGDHTCGAFMVANPSDPRLPLRVIAAAGEGWDHVSVSTIARCPTWEEMEYIKRMFFEEHETAMQLHVPPCDHVNCHPFVLHLWRPHDVQIPRPPSIMVGPS